MSAHLSDLELERYLHDPPDAGLGAAVEQHTAGCGICRDRVAAMRSMNATPVQPPAALRGGSAGPATRSNVVPLQRRPVVRVALALAAGVLIAVALPRISGGDADGIRADGIRLKGASFDVGFWLHDGARQRLVHDGDRVSPGDRLGFRVASAEPGWLLIAGVDERGPAYPCFPQSAPVKATRIAATGEAVALDAAVRFDDQEGLERIVALRCDAPFALSDVRAALERGARSGARRLPPLRPGCAQREITLRKVRQPKSAHPGGAGAR